MRSRGEEVFQRRHAFSGDPEQIFTAYVDSAVFKITRSFAGCTVGNGDPRSNVPPANPPLWYVTFVPLCRGLAHNFKTSPEDLGWYLADFDFEYYENFNVSSGRYASGLTIKDVITWTVVPHSHYIAFIADWSGICENLRPGSGIIKRIQALLYPDCDLFLREKAATTTEGLSWRWVGFHSRKFVRNELCWFILIMVPFI